MSDVQLTLQGTEMPNGKPIFFLPGRYMVTDINQDLYGNSIVVITEKPEIPSAQVGFMQKEDIGHER